MNWNQGKVRVAPEARTGPGSRRTRAWSRALLCLLLFLLTACAAKKNFQRAQEADTIEAYQAFVEEYPKKEKYVKKAEKRLEELSFQKVCEQDAFSAYTEFLARYPVGPFSQEVRKRGEDLRAQELGIHLYRTLPADYYEKVTTRYLPYRVLVRSWDPQGTVSAEVETNWYKELEARDLFVPMDPQKSYPVGPDMSIYVRQGVIYLCGSPLAFAEAEVRVRGTPVKTYRVAANRIEKVLLYEIFTDRPLYDGLLGIPEEQKKAVSERFDAFRQGVPIHGSVAVEVDIRQDAYTWDREMSLEWPLFLVRLDPYDHFATYIRGQPPEDVFRQRVYLRVDPETHAPYVRTQWSSVGPQLRWNEWNSKWIVVEQDYFFKKLTLDLVDFLSGKTAPSQERQVPDGRPIYLR